ncbi:glycine zipper family protein [Gordonia sp. TBRC 11910]|uniref:Glycine zipper family protein n=1 Tax=Gordonia asplenii TaxID=2725283 RepID=A0A848L223_9ACTN|nr:glycine zipper family protein [Gordonia asplenii]NMO04779.1 glycine zipper family protein [Gordonia asplenii]
MGNSRTARGWGHRIRWTIAATAIATATATGAAAVAQAAPTTPAPVSYKATLVGHTVKLDVTNGALVVDGTNVTMRDRTGADVLRIPLRYNLEDRTYPIATKVASSRSITLIPIRDATKSTKADTKDVSNGAVVVERRIRGYQSKQERDDAAYTRFQSQVASAMTISTIVGLAIGLVVGALLVGIPTCATIVACVPGILLGGSLGSAVGIVAGGGGAIFGYGIQYFNTINSPFVPQYYTSN